VGLGLWAYSVSSPATSYRRIVFVRTRRALLTLVRDGLCVHVYSNADSQLSEYITNQNHSTSSVAVAVLLASMAQGGVY